MCLLKMSYWIYHEIFIHKGKVEKLYYILFVKGFIDDLLRFFSVIIQKNSNFINIESFGYDLPFISRVNFPWIIKRAILFNDIYEIMKENLEKFIRKRSTNNKWHKKVINFTFELMKNVDFSFHHFTENNIQTNESASASAFSSERWISYWWESIAQD